MDNNLVSPYLLKQADIQNKSLVENVAACATSFGNAFVGVEKNGDQELCELIRAKVLELAHLEMQSKSLGVALAKVRPCNVLQSD